MKHPIAIIIPLYKERLTDFETISIKQCFKMLSSHKIIAIKPSSLSLEHYPYPFDSIQNFDDRFFQNIAGYNRLMLSPSFYERFLQFKHILIYQPDAFVFSDQLLYWCNMDYDYIGAPWLRTGDYPDMIKRGKNTLLRYYHTKLNIRHKVTGLPHPLQFENRVGNGGFSLRNTQRFFDIANSSQRLIDFYLSKAHHQFNEDAFWSIEVNRKRKQLNIPGYQTAVRFSIENDQAYALKITGGELPFGCHDWIRNLDFWRPYFTEAGYDI